MKFYININQKALHDLSKDLDIIDGAILDYIIHFCSIKDSNIDQIVVKEKNEDFIYTWIDYTQLINEMPLLKINQISSISKRLKRLEKIGLIKKTLEKDPIKGGWKIYIRVTEKTKGLFFSRYEVKTERKKKKKRDPMEKIDMKEVIDKLKNAKRKDLRIAGQWFERMPLSEPTYGAFDSQLARYLREAKKLLGYNEERILAAMDKAIEESQRLEYSPSLSTVLKKIDSIEMANINKTKSNPLLYGK